MCGDMQTKRDFMMAHTSISSLKKLIVAAAIPLFAACGGMSPGMHFDNARVDDADGPATAEAPVQTVIKPITPNLVKREREMREKQTSSDISKLVVNKVRPYGIEPGDVLSIVVWDHPELTGASTVPAVAGVDPGANNTQQVGFTVDHDGVIQFPYAGNLKVTGMSEDQVQKLLTTKLAHYIQKPKVTVRIQNYRSKRVYIDGEVKNPGLQAINDIPMTLTEALNRAGGMLPTADQSRISLTRGGATYHLNLPQMVQKGVNPSSIMLTNGDLVRVMSRDENKVFVSGEVIQPRALTMHNGKLTLNEALGESGGVNPLSGDSRQIYVVRKSATEPIVYKLDAQAPGALAVAEGFELQPKDIVYVAATPLANWHRTISQIFPGALSAAVGTVVAPTPVAGVR
jgi:polysaccharide export outer membrane protein